MRHYPSGLQTVLLCAHFIATGLECLSLYLTSVMHATMELWKSLQKTPQGDLSFRDMSDVKGPSSPVPYLLKDDIITCASWLCRCKLVQLPPQRLRPRMQPTAHWTWTRTQLWRSACPNAQTTLSRCNLKSIAFITERLTSCTDAEACAGRDCVLWGTDFTMC